MKKLQSALIFTVEIFWSDVLHYYTYILIFSVFYTNILTIVRIVVQLSMLIIYESKKEEI